MDEGRNGRDCSILAALGCVEDASKRPLPLNRFPQITKAVFNRRRGSLPKNAEFTVPRNSFIVSRMPRNFMARVLPDCVSALGRIVLVVLMLAFAQEVFAQRPNPWSTPGYLDRLNPLLSGRVVDFTHNHGADQRLYSAILGQPRDLYVYVPPGYSPARAYPLVLWLHGAFGDEHSFLDQAELEYLDAMIVHGHLPPMIVACPDGTYGGENHLRSDHSLYLNGRRGRMQDHLLCEVLPFLMTRFSVLADRRGHAVIGVSAGGAGALNLALKHPESFGAAVAVAGAANLRYDNLQGNYFADFDPATYRWKSVYRPDEIIAEYAAGLVRIRAERFIEPVFGEGPEVVPWVANENPADLLFRLPLPVETPILLCYGGRDQFNMDAQGASFAWLARCLGLHVDIIYDPTWDHTPSSFRPAQRQALHWLGQRLPWPVE
jgi:pimeloyl-ACP methyl ester carboxylesterase